MTRSIRVRLNAAALLLAITGMIIQIASGVKYPTVTPGIVILAATALLITLVRWPAPSPQLRAVALSAKGVGQIPAVPGGWSRIPGLSAPGGTGGFL